MGQGKRILGIMGCGTMGQAILRGLMREKVPPSQILGSDKRPAVLAELGERYGIQTTSDNETVARQADVLLLCIKPQQIPGAVTVKAIQAALREKLVVSIAAGVKLAQLESWLPESHLVRAMPNTAAVIGQGMTALARGGRVTDEQLSAVEEIFSAVGRCVEIDEVQMDVVTALSGSGPAFAYVMVEALADGAVRMGLPRDLALSIAAQMLRGAASMVLETGQHPAVLKDQVTTPGGCTIAGLLTLEDGALRGTLARTIEETTRTAAGLGGGHKAG